MLSFKLMSIVLFGAMRAHSAVSVSPAEKPHIVMVLADDVGWANVGWNRAVPTREVQTPSMDALVADGIELQQFYTFK